MDVIKLVAFGIVGFLLLSAYHLIIGPANFDNILIFGLVGMFIGFGVGFEIIGFKSINAKYFMAVIGMLFTSILMYVLDFSLFFGIIGGVVGLYYKTIIDIYLKS
ncbi:hypothetical protein [Vibrio sp. AND4]|uniref:hypothetical protein n=1 Tax=Vibrio sp. AND4 TaxID=314289 RepID=UPI00015F351C|nr:hypothetical protein [Vibrio sp. AND4]EDP59508.1 hypothetical protein AND4_10139 [Vibrio sp. AND4]